MEADGSQDGQFSGSIITCHVIGGIRFGISLFLGHPEGIAIAYAGIIHIGKDEIGGTVHNAHNAFNFVSCQGIMKRS